MKCFAHLPAAREKPIREVGTALFHYLSPLISPTAQRDLAQALASNLNSLCEDAWEFRMMMRRSREEYCVWTPDSSRHDSLCAKPSELSELVDCMAVERGKIGSESDEIAYTLFGGLTKHPEYRGGELCVLEKAQVVLKRK